MREDRLAKLLFFVGCAGLPWLWTVHIMYFAGKKRREALGDVDTTPDHTTTGGASGLLNGESMLETDEPGNPADMDLEEKKWVRREFLGMVLVYLAWLTWIIVFQVLIEYFPPGWLVRGEDEGESTGW